MDDVDIISTIIIVRKNSALQRLNWHGGIIYTDESISLSHWQELGGKTNTNQAGLSEVPVKGGIIIELLLINKEIFFEQMNCALQMQSVMLHIVTIASVKLLWVHKSGILDFFCTREISSPERDFSISGTTSTRERINRTFCGHRHFMPRHFVLT